jgi:hypothetical protein
MQFYKIIQDRKLDVEKMNYLDTAPWRDKHQNR